jgi:hypothetical protein
MNLRHLRTFVQITEAGGVARAAGRLNLSQPTVSRQIRALEDALGHCHVDGIFFQIRSVSLQRIVIFSIT